MRLIHTQTYEFENFEESECPPYAILSHRWERDEISLQDVLDHGIGNLDKKGALKIRECCKIALQDNLRYVWVDTCCIDKTSSAELSEAINSMFRWYQLAELCIAYLGDVELGQPIELSQWFSRAWTLQELIAPQHVHFYSVDWQSLGSKIEHSQTITARTNVPHDVLTYTKNIYTLPVAQRMSWARRRKSTRVEDIAYSLLGIFDVNMPLLYGEGVRAFLRLQEEIIRSNHDQTIFLWSAFAKDVGKVLAPSPDNFDPGRSFHFRPSQRGQRPFAITNVGLELTVPLVPHYARTYLGLLDCESETDSSAGFQDHWSRPGLYLRKRPDSDLFEKVNFPSHEYGFDYLDTNRTWGRIKHIHVALDPAANARDSTQPRGFPVQPIAQHDEPDELYGFVIRSLEYRRGRTVSNLLPDCQIITEHHWDEATGTVEMQAGTAGDAITVELPRDPHVPRAIRAFKLGFNFDFEPCCVIVPITENTLELQETIKLLDSIALYKEQAWLGHQFPYLVPLPPSGCWLLKGDLSLGFSVKLGPSTSPVQRERDYCFAHHQIIVRMTREAINKKIAWILDLYISPCPLDYCSSHEGSNVESITFLPENIVSPTWDLSWHHQIR